MGSGASRFELPCGAPDRDGEDVLAAMKRELLEETGYASEEWHSLGSSTANTGRQNNRVHSFLALARTRSLTRSSIPARSSAPMSCLGAVPRGAGRGKLEIPGLHVAALWQLRTFAKKTRDPRLLGAGTLGAPA